MAQSLTAKLLKLTEVPVATDLVIKALRGEIDDVAPLVRALQAEAETVTKARQALADVPPVATQTGPVVLL